MLKSKAISRKTEKSKKALRKSKSKKVKSATAKKTAAVPEPKKILEEPILLQNPRGMRDILPGEQSYWEQVRKVTERGAKEYGFSRIDVPLVGFSEIFSRSIGKGTDIVEKEMYVFKTRGGEMVALRPEFTATIARAYIQHGMNVLHKPIKLFSIGPVYRYDRPQEGRYREHWQANFDVFGEQDPILDAQVIQLANRVVKNLGIKDIQIQVNSIGCSQCRKDYNELLVNYLESKKHKLCQKCRERLENNPMRILDCKEDKCAQVAAGAPQTVDHLCPECREHFKKLLEYLDELELPYMINPYLVRGLDYYTKTVFEIWSGVSDDEGGKKKSLGGGGRYDNLIKILGGEDTPAVGFGLGLDRLVLEMKKVNAKPYRETKPKVFLAQLGDLAKRKSLKLFEELEKNGILVAESFGRGSLKSQMRTADRLGVEVTLIVGQKEALDDTVIVKDMTSGVQEIISREKIADRLKRLLKTNNVVVVKNK